jgi:hypothetical protein
MSDTHAAVGEGEDQAKKTTDSRSVNDYAGQEPKALLNPAADHLWLRSLSLRLIHTGLKGDGSFNLRFAHPSGERKSQ